MSTAEQVSRVCIDAATLDALTPRLGPTTMMLYITLLRHAGADGRCWPSYRFLASHLHTSLSTIQRGVLSLESRGLIRISRERSEGKYRNTYTVRAADRQIAEKASQPAPLGAFVLTDDDIAWAFARGFNTEAIEDETEKFVAFYRGRKQITRADWGQEWRRWMVKAGEYARRGSAPLHALPMSNGAGEVIHN